MLIDTLKPHCVHIWKVSIKEQLSRLKQLRGLLSEDERIRADRFVTQALTETYICTRGLLRDLLSKYLNVSGDRVQFVKGDHGKPFLRHDKDVLPLHFNVSHSSDCAVYAFCRDFELGVDVENTQRSVDPLALAERFFTSEEHQELQDLQGDAQRQRFFYFWTRKEALLKATGKGLTQSLDSIDVRQESLCVEQCRWLLRTLDAEYPYCLSVAVVPEITDIQLMSE